MLIPGDMGRYSFVLVGTEQALKETFGSTCHGAGREMSRAAAIKAAKGRNIVRELAGKGIIVRGAGRDTIDEEISEAYKDVEGVVNVTHGAGISRKVAKLKPLVIFVILLAAIAVFIITPILAIDWVQRVPFPSVLLQPNLLVSDANGFDWGPTAQLDTLDRVVGINDTPVADQQTYDQELMKSGLAGCSVSV